MWLSVTDIWLFQMLHIFFLGDRFLEFRTGVISPEPANLPLGRSQVPQGEKKNTIRKGNGKYFLKNDITALGHGFSIYKIENINQLIL